MDLWTKYYFAVKEHPKTLQLATTLNIHRAEACGLLANLWAWAVCANVAPNGDISMYREARIEKECAWEGEAGEFISALFACGWLDGSFSDDSACIHDWAEYGGALAVERERAAERKKNQRLSRGQSQGQSRGQSRGQSQGQSQGIDIDVDGDIESESEKEKEKEQHRQSQIVNSQRPYHSPVIDRLVWGKWREKEWDDAPDKPGDGNPIKVQEYFSGLYPDKEKPTVSTIKHWLQFMSEKALLWIIDQAYVAKNPVAYAAECVNDKIVRKCYTYEAIQAAENQRS